MMATAANTYQAAQVAETSAPKAQPACRVPACTAMMPAERCKTAPLSIDDTLFSLFKS